MLKLYMTPGTCAQASHIALREADAEFEIRRVDFATAEQRQQDFLRVNPKGRVPALATERGILTETPAILTWIAQQYPDQQLCPADDPFRFAEMQSFLSYLCATVHPAHAHSRRGERWADDPAAIAEMQRKAPQVFAACFEMIEIHYLTGPWVLGDDYCVADPYLFTISQWLPGHGIDVADYPKVADHQQRMLQRPAVQAAMAAEAV